MEDAKNMAEHFLSLEEQSLIVEAIKEAELNTSGEIRLHVEAACDEDPVERAQKVFDKLGMGRTVQRNGVLFYLAYEQHKFAIIGDSGIHEKVTDSFWNEEKEMLLSYFKKSEYCEGLCIAIKLAGTKLKEHFPYQSDDTDELSNEITFGENNND